ncbi:MAG: nucleotide exchange factor GrpE [Candidatus Omnitrophica bacterium]|nr:nucleotide exchange factor GrpE [Candidatus Omnitrophota bacterium]
MKHKDEEKQKAEVTISEEEYAKLKEDSSKKSEYWDKFLRQQAEFENFRKRLDKEKSQFLKYANETIILELLTVLDDLERLISLAETHKQDFETFLKGVEMILAHLYELLKKQGVKPIDAKDKKFDPLFHEALMSVESDKDEDSKIIEELQKGYILDDRVIRTAKVKVAKKSGVKDIGPEENK